MDSRKIKKQLALISAITLVAGSAAYLPANISSVVSGSQVVSANAVATPEDQKNKTETNTVNKITYSVNGGEETELYEEANCELPDLSGSNDNTYAFNDKSISLPENTPANAEITIRVTPQTDAAADVNTITFNLGDDGTATLADDTKIVAISDTAKFDESGNLTEGNRDTLNFGGLTFKVPAISSGHMTSQLNDDATGNGGSNVKKVNYNGNDVYATVIKATVSSNTQPGASLKWTISPSYNWTASSKEVNFTLGNDGTAESDVVAVSKGDTVEYYVLQVTKSDTTVLKDTVAGYSVGSNEATTMDTLVSQDGSYKTSKKETQVIDGKFVTVYTIAHDDTSLNEVTIITGVADIEDAKDRTAKITLENGNGESEVINFKKSKKETISVDTTKNVAEDSGEYVKYVFTTTYDVQLVNPEITDTTKQVIGYVTVKDGAYSKIATPEYAGYTFGGWYINKSFTEDKDLAINNLGVTTINPSSDTAVLYAKFDAINYTVKFDANGGSFADSSGYTAYAVDNGKFTVLGKPFKSSEVAEMKSTATKTGYKFKGWAKTADADKALTNDELKALSSKSDDTVTLYAVWEANKNSVIADKSKMLVTDSTGKLNSTSDDSISFADNKSGSLTVVTDAAFGELPVAVKKGWTFDGWYYEVTEKDVTSYVKVTDKTILTADLTETVHAIYPKFTQDTYTITYDLDGGSWGTTVVPTTYQYTGNSVSIPTPTKGSGSYYTFDGWYVNGSDKATKTLSKDYAENLTLKAKWIVNSDKADNGVINFQTNGGDFYTQVEAKVEYDVTCDYNKVNANEVSLSGIKNTEIESTVIINGDTVTAKDSKVYKVARAGYKFGGWYLDEACTDGNEVTFDKYPDGTEVDVYAKWIPLKNTKFRLNYTLVNADGSLVDSDYDEGFTKAYIGTTGTIADASKYTFTVDGVKYVYDEENSDDSEAKQEIKAKYAERDFGVTYYNLTATGYTTITATYKEEVKEVVKVTAPENVKVSGNTVTWDAVNGAEKYIAYKVVNGKAYAGTEVTGTSYTFNKMTGVTAVYVVAVGAGDNNTAQSESVKVEQIVKVTAPTNVKLDGNKVTWTAVKGAKSYQVYKVVNGKKYAGTAVTGTSYTFKNLTGATEIYVVATGEGTNNTAQSASVKIEQIVKVTAPANVKLDGNKVTWDAVKGAEKYIAYKVSSDGKAYAGTEVTGTSYTFAKMNGVTAVYVVAIGKGDNNKAESAKVEVVKVTAPTNVKLNGTTVTWTAVKGAKSYKVYKVVNGKTYAGTAITGTTYTFKNITGADEVYVAAIDSTGKEYKSASVYIVTAPKNVKVDGNKVTWTAVKGAKSYQAYKVSSDGKVYAGTSVTGTSYTFNKMNGVTAVYVVATDANGKQYTSAKVAVK